MNKKTKLVSRGDSIMKEWVDFGYFLIGRINEELINEDQPSCADFACKNRPIVYMVQGERPVIALPFSVCEVCGEQLMDNPEKYLERFHRYNRATKDPCRVYCELRDEDEDVCSDQDELCPEKVAFLEKIDTEIRKTKHVCGGPGIIRRRCDYRDLFDGCSAYESSKRSCGYELNRKDHEERFKGGEIDEG